MLARSFPHLNFILGLPSNADKNSLAAAHARLERVALFRQSERSLK